MDQLRAKYLGPDVPVQERLFYLATFLSSVTNLAFVSVGLFAKLNFKNGVLYFAMALAALTFFLLEKKFHKTDLFATLFLFVINFILYPLIFMSGDYITVEVTMYMFIGFTYSLLLLKGKKRIIMCGLQVIYVIGLAYYVFVLDNRGSLTSGASSSDQFWRLELSIIVSGVICGIMTSYRNKIFKDEMKLREQATKEAEDASYAKDMFLVNVSHELRTPLNAIIGTTDLLLDSNVSRHVRDMVVNISNSSRALINITTDLLDFSGSSMENTIPECDRYDASFMITDILNLMSVRLLDKEIKFSTYINPSIPKFLFGDNDKIRGILINLLSNAIKYTSSGEIVFTVDFSYEPDDSISLIFKVSDTGVGIKPENIEKIFEPFNRSGDSIDRIIEGNGIGLPLCKKIAEAMGGSITVESEFSIGSDFTFTVPQIIDTHQTETFGHVNNSSTRILFYTVNDNEDNLEKTLSEMKVLSKKAVSVAEFMDECSKDSFDMYIIDLKVYESIKSSLVHRKTPFSKLCVIGDCNYSNAGEPYENVLTKPVNCINVAEAINRNRFKVKRKLSYNSDLCIKNATVLVVDDDLTNLTVASGLLSRYEAKVIQAASGREAINTIEKYDIDIIFLDYMMPDMDGIDTLKAIKKIKEGIYSDIPVVVLTANVVSGAKEMFMEAGFNDYLSKPIEIDKLEKMLVDYLPPELIENKSESVHEI